MKQILLVEDGADDILLIKQVLSQAGLSLRLNVAMDGEQALEVLANPEFKPDLIILDLNIPKIHGLNLLERWSGKTPVVVFSSTTDERAKQRALALGARDVVSKPMDLYEFTESFCGMVRKWAMPKEGEMSVEA